MQTLFFGFAVESPSLLLFLLTLNLLLFFQGPLCSVCIFFLVFFKKAIKFSDLDAEIH